MDHAAAESSVSDQAQPNPEVLAADEEPAIRSPEPILAMSEEGSPQTQIPDAEAAVSRVVNTSSADGISHEQRTVVSATAGQIPSSTSDKDPELTIAPPLTNDTMSEVPEEKSGPSSVSSEEAATVATQPTQAVLQAHEVKHEDHVDLPTHNGDVLSSETKSADSSATTGESNQGDSPIDCKSEDEYPSSSACAGEASLKRSTTFDDSLIFCSNCTTSSSWRSERCPSCSNPFPPLNVIIRVIQARYLHPRNFNGTVDPLCRLSLNQSGRTPQPFKTHCQIKTISPVWNDEFELTVAPYLPDCELVAEVVTWGYVTDVPLGSIKIDLRAGLGRRWYRLNNASSGEIQLEILPATDATPLGQGHKYKLHFDKVAGTILAAGKLGSVVSSIGSTIMRRFASAPQTQANDSPLGVPPEEQNNQGSAWRSYRTYSLELLHISEVFGAKRQKWNSKYDAAIKIFSPGAASAIVRAGIMAEHKSLFSTMASQAGVLYCGEEFLNLMNYGLMEGKRRRYTYVIAGSRITWAETSGSFAKDFLSKHAVLANAAYEVVYSGEFFIVSSPSRVGDYEFIIDNSSGTYAPKAEDLPKVQELFRKNFPDMVTHALVPDDPRMKVYRQILSECGATTTGFMGHHKPRVLTVEEKKSILESPVANNPHIVNTESESEVKTVESLNTTILQPSSDPMSVPGCNDVVISDIPVAVVSNLVVQSPPGSSQEKPAIDSDLPAVVLHVD